MSITRVGTAAIEVLKQDDFNHSLQICYGDSGLIDEIACRAWESWRKYHALDRHQKVLNALDRDHRFEKDYFLVIDGVGRNPERESHHRYFTLKDEYREPTHHHPDSDNG